MVDPTGTDPEPEWGQSLSRGAPGIALLHITRARTGQGTWHTAHQWAAAATRAPISAHRRSGLFHGVTAVAYAIAYADHPGYTTALHTLDTNIEELTAHRLCAAHARIDRAELPALAEYDLISGLTGIGCYLLRRHPDDAAVRAVLDYLVRLTLPLRPPHHDAALPGWWTGNDHTDRPSSSLPGGHANFGMAHGITGPLALLATALRRGVTVDGHAEAIDRICRWLDTWRQGHGTTTWWPAQITAQEYRTGRTRQPGPGRPSWCYGTPGLARAQQLAALALDDPHRQRAAEQAILGCITNPRPLAELTGSTLCHGWAGLLLTAARAAADASTGVLTERLLALKTRLAAPTPQPAAQVGLLDGAAGIELTRTAADAEQPWPWDACLLTAG
ncbi:lanthionine synthetase [Actinomadura sp. 7K507]|nr:lanthionine synthetase [Actinomadura sp. 7K507]